MRTRIERLSFTGSGGDQLAGRLHRPEGEPTAVALFAHCFTCGKDIRAAARIATALAEEGVAVLRFDFTGLGESEGDFADTHFSSNVEDLLAAADALRDGVGAPRLLVGHSLGGTAVLAAAPGVPECRAVVTIGAPCEPAHVTRLLHDAEDEARLEGAVGVSIGGRPFTIGRGFFDDITRHSVAASLPDLGRSLLVMHAPLDSIVDVENARCLYEAARHPKSFVSLDGADHLLSRAADADWVGRLVAAWASRWVDAPAPPEAPATTGENVVTVRGGRSRLATEIVAGGHRLRADEPAALGGSDTGPTPYGFLLAGLGACTSMTLRLYADRKGWPLEEVVTRLRHERVHREDCDDCDERERRVEVIHADIELVGDLDAEQRARLLEIAQRCPVHRTLGARPDIKTSLSRSAEEVTP